MLLENFPLFKAQGQACTSNSQCGPYGLCCGSFCSSCCEDTDCPSSDICIIQVRLSSQKKLLLVLKDVCVCMSPVSPVFCTLASVSIGLKSTFKMMTSNLQY